MCHSHENGNPQKLINLRFFKEDVSPLAATNDVLKAGMTKGISSYDLYIIKPL